MLQKSGRLVLWEAMFILELHSAETQALQESGLFPPMVYQMIRIGEESGNTEEMLDKLADYYEEEVEMEVQSLMAALEPMIIIVLAIVVGGLLAACMMPMMSMYEALDAM